MTDYKYWQVKLEDNIFRQVYEFVGVKNEHLDNIDLGMLLPIYQNNVTSKYTHTVIKNVVFSCDTLTTTGESKNYVTNKAKLPPQPKKPKVQY